MEFGRLLRAAGQRGLGRVKQQLFELIPDVPLTLRLPLGGKIKYSARAHKGFIGGFRRFPHELAILEWYRRNVLPGMVVFDVGANIGAHSVMLAHLVGAGGKVVAFEPDPDNVRWLQANLELNLLKNVMVVQAAVSDQLGTARFWRDTFSTATGTLAPQANNSGYHAWYGKPAEVMQVATVRLDDFAAQSGLEPDLIKVDVEGAETAVVVGMRGLLAGKKPKLVIDGAGRETLEALTGHSYRLWDLMRGGRELAPGDVPEWCFAATPR